jgi:hypothetical protein
MGTPEQHANRGKRNECSRGFYLTFGPLHAGYILIPGRAEERCRNHQDKNLRVETFCCKIERNSALARRGSP